MPKSIEEVERFKPPNDPDEREVVVIETDDGVRYIFERRKIKTEEDVEPQPSIMFSHRYYPTEPAGENHVASNYRLPEKVDSWVRSEYGDYDYLDGLIPEARQNQVARAKLHS